MRLIDPAIRAHVVINSLDARGLTYLMADAFHAFQEQVTYGTSGTLFRKFTYVAQTTYSLKKPDRDSRMRSWAALPS
jgi:hypothetical protein